MDFPTAPVVGQQYPFTPVPGQPVFIWDGEKWTAAPTTGAVPSGAVRYDTAQSLTSTQQTQARSNVYAAPFDALAYSGMQINGGMEVSQELGTLGGRTTYGYVADGWFFSLAGSMALLAVTGPAAPLSAIGITNATIITVTTAQSSLGAGDHCFIAQPIEGYRVVRLQYGTANAQPITICFWSGHHRTGLYSVSIRNAARNRSYIATYTQAVADVAQYNVLTVPGDTTGTWAVNNTEGLHITFSNGAGSTYIAPSPNVWAAGNYHCAPGQVNGVAATSDIFRLTGVTVLPGTQAPTAAQSPNIMRPYDQELVTCQRYLWMYSAPAPGVRLANGYNDTTGGGHCMMFSPVPMRAVPTVAFNKLSNLQGTVTAGSISSASNVHDIVYLRAGLPVGPTQIFTEASDSFLKLDARL